MIIYINNGNRNNNDNNHNKNNSKLGNREMLIKELFRRRGRSPLVGVLGLQVLALDFHHKSRSMYLYAYMHTLKVCYMKGALVVFHGKVICGGTQSTSAMLSIRAAQELMYNLFQLLEMAKGFISYS